MRVWKPPALHPRSRNNMQPLRILWSRVWAHREPGALAPQPGGQQQITTVLTSKKTRSGWYFTLRRGM
jgi:hypothetical protein